VQEFVCINFCMDLQRHQPDQPQASGLGVEDAGGVGPPLGPMVEALQYARVLEVSVVLPRQKR
jgi:hypothetical protein